jgi:hypothetical protein
LDTFSDIINNLLLFKIRKTNQKSRNGESKGRARIPQPDPLLGLLTRMKVYRNSTVISIGTSTRTVLTEIL